MLDRVNKIADDTEEETIAYRRDVHKHAESGWCEFRTASLVARRLTDLGYKVQAGRQVVSEEDRMGLPAPEVLERRWKRARDQGGDPEYLEAVRGGFTGVVGTLRRGIGPTVGLRFDMDANDLAESRSPDHRPFREGFASVNEEATHSCGHDGHVAVGLAVAAVLMALKDHLHGTVKLIFQPAEEGVRGAKSMVSAGVVDDVDFLLGHHLHSGWELNAIEPGRSGFLATTKFDASFAGSPAHAGSRPNEGNNALLAAATAVLNLNAIPRHRDGVTRVNVGRLIAGTGRNVICSDAQLVIETRGATSELNEYMYAYAIRILEAAAAMHACTVRIEAMGSAKSGESDSELAARVAGIVEELPGLCIRPPEGGSGSEDFTYMMARVQGNGGLATNIGVGADLGGWGHHTAEFDIDEVALTTAVRLLSLTTLDLLAKDG
jgi:aminobenzoyl-glutamate utilization protein A